VATGKNVPQDLPASTPTDNSCEYSVSFPGSEIHPPPLPDCLTSGSGQWKKTKSEVLQFHNTDCSVSEEFFHCFPFSRNNM